MKNPPEVLEKNTRERNMFTNGNINCQSGGVLSYTHSGVNMKVEMIIDALKDYLEQGKNEQALIDFLES